MSFPMSFHIHDPFEYGISNSERLHKPDNKFEVHDYPSVSFKNRECCEFN